MTLKYKWIDSGREPKVRPDPRFPKGKDVGIPDGGEPSCKVALPYPARRCGYYMVECDVCGTNALITTAGRPDDPRRVTLPCKGRLDA